MKYYRKIIKHIISIKAAKDSGALNDLIKDSLKTALDDIKIEYLEYVESTLKNQILMDNFIDIMGDRIDQSYSLILNELEKDKRTEEKLYIIMKFSRNLIEDLHNMYVDKLRMVKTDI